MQPTTGPGGRPVLKVESPDCLSKWFCGTAAVRGSARTDPGVVLKALACFTDVHRRRRIQSDVLRVCVLLPMLPVYRR